VFVEFDEIQIDGWENDQFVLYINGRAVSAQELRSRLVLDEAGNAVLENMQLQNSNADNLGFSAVERSRIRHYVVRVATNGGPLTIGFGANLDQNVFDESWGVDNVRISYLEKTNQVDAVLVPAVDQANGPKNLIVNGSFEIFTNAKETSWGHATQSLAGWALEAGTRFEPHKPRSGITATDGSVWLDMGLSPGNLAISQHVDGVEDGKLYTLSFDLADSVSDKTDGIEVYWNGEKIADIDRTDANWTRHSFQVRGGDGDGTDTLVFKGTGEENNFGVSLDNVEMFETAEPLQVPEVISGAAGDRLPLDIQLDDAIVGSGNHVVVSGVPQGAILTAGTQNNDGTWTVAASELASVALRVPTNYSGEVNLSITTAVVLDGSVNMVRNGSFEDNQVNGPGWSVFEKIPGWNTTTGRGIEIQESLGFVGLAADGNSLVELDSYNNSGMEQEITTSLDQTYRLSVQYSPRPGVPELSNLVEVYWNGEKIGSMTGNGVGVSGTRWQTFTFDVAGTGVPTALEFRAAGTADSLGGLIDDVQLNPIVAQHSTSTVVVAASNDPNNFIVNGSFENLSGLAKTGFGFTGKTVEGWNLEAGPAIEVHNPRAGVDEAADGAYWLDMDASPGNVVISQQVLGFRNWQGLYTFFPNSEFQSLCSQRCTS
jgi:hypothetical protein